MASLNVAEWSPDQVADWLTGLGGPVERYVPGLRARAVDGTRLLALRCDDLEALGVRAIGHQELVLDALEHLRNFQYELRRECVQQLAVRVSVVAESLARALAQHTDARLETQSLADVARTVGAVKPLASWLAQVGGGAGGGGGAGAVGGAGARGELWARGAALLALALEAATCAQRDRFAEQPARAVRASAAATAAAADYIIQEVSDPLVLQPALLSTVTLSQGARPLGFAVVPSCCGHARLAHIRFGSPAHACGQVRDGDEIVQVGPQCVVGWSGDAVLRLCRANASRCGELTLRLRRRAPRPPAPALHPRPRAAPARLALPPHAELAPDPPPAPRAPSPAGSSDSEPLSPPASPTHMHPDRARLYPPKPRAAAQRRHSVSGGSPVRARPGIAIDQLWQELQERRWRGASPQPDDAALYRRDKAVSCSGGLEQAPRPRTCLGVPLHHPLLLQLERRAGGAHRPARPAPTPAPPSPSHARGRLDKAHSTPAYDFDAPHAQHVEYQAGGALASQPIPESPTTPPDGKADQILDFKKSSSQLGEALLHARPRAPPPPPPPAPAPAEATNETLLERHSGLLAASTSDRVTLAPFVLEANTSYAEDDQFGEDEFRVESLGSGADNAQAPEPPPRPAAPALGARAHSPHAHAHAPAGAPGHEYPVLRHVRADNTHRQEYSVLKPCRAGGVGAGGGAAPQISVPLRHLSPHDLRAVTLPLPAPAPAPVPASLSPPPAPASPQDIQGGPASPTQAALSPTGGGAGGMVRGIFPSSKSRSLKKKNSLLAKRRLVPARALASRGAAGAVWQRVRARRAAQPRWARRHLLLAHNMLYAYRSPECQRADCMIKLSGCTVSAAGEVRSRAHAFKVYHTGSAFYFACESRDAMLAWIQLIHRATLLPPHEAAERGQHAQLDISQQFSETDYSTESDEGHPERRERDRERDAKEREKEKDKSKFGSLKKLTGRVARSESQESVGGGGGAAGGGGGGGGASLDRKYLRFFSRRAKEDKPAKSKPAGACVPVPTEHYRSYRRPADSSPASPSSPLSPAPAPAPAASSPARLPRRRAPINYIHASNPNLLQFEAPPPPPRPPPSASPPATLRPAPAPAPTRARAPHAALPAHPHSLLGFVTLEEFMLKEQEEERRQVYTNRVLMGIERTRAEGRNAECAPVRARELHEQLQRIVPDVIYGEGPAGALRGRALPAAPPAPPAHPAHTADRRRSPQAHKPISVKGKDGYEKIVYPEEFAVNGSASAELEASADSAECAARLGYETIYGPEPAPPRRRTPPPPPQTQPAGPDRWRDSLRRNDKVHSGAGDAACGGGGAGGVGGAVVPAALKSAAQYTPLSLAAPAAQHLQLHADSGCDAAGVGAGAGAGGAAGGASSAGGVSRLRLMFGARSASRDAKQHEKASPTSGAASAPATVGRAGGGAVQYPHLQCPPTFQPETYSLARLKPPRRDSPPTPSPTATSPTPTPTPATTPAQAPPPRDS